MSKDEIAQALQYPYSQDAAMLDAICDVLVHIPPEARDFALANCTFITIGERAYGTCFVSTAVTRLPRIILLDGGTILAERAFWAIAHEIAHAFLGHGPGTPEEEDEASALAAEWGYPRVDDDGDFYEMS